MVSRSTLDSSTLERELTTDLRDDTPDAPKGPPLHTRILIGLVIGAVAGVTANAVLGPTNPGLVAFTRNVTEPRSFVLFTAKLIRA